MEHILFSDSYFTNDFTIRAMIQNFEHISLLFSASLATEKYLKSSQITEMCFQYFRVTSTESHYN